jgi:hypothetical protein
LGSELYAQTLWIINKIVLTEYFMNSLAKPKVHNYTRWPTFL